jgi:hypothetical protein
MTSTCVRQSTAVLIGTLVGLWAITASAAPISDDFESRPLGSFPAGPWLDVAAVVPSATPSDNAPIPSATVVATTDAFGAATKAQHQHQLGRRGARAHDLGLDGRGPRADGLGAPPASGLTLA